MIVYDENGKRIEDYDLSKGRLESKSKRVEHRWVVDSKEQGEWVTKKEYPKTGGKDVEWRVTVSERGHWKTTDAEGKEVVDFDGTFSDDWPHDVPVPDIFKYAVYHAYTSAELAELAEKKRKEEQARQDAQEKADIASTLPDAVADLSEQVSNNANDCSDLSDAVAELSVLVSNLVEAK